MFFWSVTTEGGVMDASPCSFCSVSVCAPLCPSGANFVFLCVCLSLFLCPSEFMRPPLMLIIASLVPSFWSFAHSGPPVLWPGKDLVQSTFAAVSLSVCAAGSVFVSACCRFSVGVGRHSQVAG